MGLFYEIYAYILCSYVEHLSENSTPLVMNWCIYFETHSSFFYCEDFLLNEMMP